MTFGRLIYWVTPENRRGFRQVWVPARFITLIFVFLDSLSFCVQCIGILFLISKFSIAGQTQIQQAQVLRTTYNILRVGFIMQIVVFGTFMLIAFRFMFASKAWKFDWPEGGNAKWRTSGWTVVAAGFLIAVSLNTNYTALVTNSYCRDVHCTAASNLHSTEARTISGHMSGPSISLIWCS